MLVRATMVNTTITASKRRLLLALFLGAGACWFLVTQASAHAAYESSTPAFAEVLAESPSEIRIRFTQELFRREGANTMELFQTQSSDLLADYEIGPVQIGNDDRNVMTANIPTVLPPGRYAVRWTNLSAEDGDVDSGWLPFYVRSEPEPWQIAEDRQLAEDLLIAYPGDEEDAPEAEATVIPAAPTVARADGNDDVALGAGPIIWLAVGAIVALVVVGALGFQLGSRRRNG